MLPHLGLGAAFLFLAALAFAGALAGALLIRERVREGVEAEDVEWTLKDMRLWRLSFGTGLYLAAQVAITGFVVLFLVDAREFLRGCGCRRARRHPGTSDRDSNWCRSLVGPARLEDRPACRIGLAICNARGVRRSSPPRLRSWCRSSSSRAVSPWRGTAFADGRGGRRGRGA